MLALVLPLLWPIPDAELAQPYGVTEFVRANPGFYAGDVHHGVDLVGQEEAPIYAPADGVVVAVGSDECESGPGPRSPSPDCNYGYGNWLLLEHQELGFFTWYQHLERKPYLLAGQAVRRGETIAVQGMSGRAFGRPHLHFAVVERTRVYTTFEGKTDVSVDASTFRDPLTLMDPLKPRKRP